jgi:ParB-like chromosome segregation protein Spo0J
VVVRGARDTNSYLLLDGHLRIEVLRDLGQTEVECLVSTDDEAFTYNKRISRLSPVQEQRMIAKAIERIRRIKSQGHWTSMFAAYPVKSSCWTG